MKGIDISKPSLASSCGDYCPKCPHYPNECSGCNLYAHPDCFFLICCADKKIEHCGQFNELPCEKLSSFVPDDRSECPKGYHIANLRRRSQIGTQSWLDEQAIFWSGKL
jgi:hypothetical protein